MVKKKNHEILRLGIICTIAGLILLWAAIRPVQVVTVTLPRQNNRMLSATRIHPDGFIRFSYRHSVELTRVEGRFQVTPDSELVAVDTRMESAGPVFQIPTPTERPWRTDGW